MERDCRAAAKTAWRRFACWCAARGRATMRSDAQPSTTDSRKTPAHRKASSARAFRLLHVLLSRAPGHHAGCVHERREEKKSPPRQDTLKSSKQTAEGNDGAKRNSEEREGEPGQQCPHGHEQRAGDDSRHHDHLGEGAQHEAHARVRLSPYASCRPLSAKSGDRREVESIG